MRYEGYVIIYKMMITNDGNMITSCNAFGPFIGI